MFEDKDDVRHLFMCQMAIVFVFLSMFFGLVYEIRDNKEINRYSSIKLNFR